MIYILGFFWFLRQIKAALFWLYLWQLKEYHIGRFLDHFRTEKGKQLIFNKFLILKTILVFVFLISFYGILELSYQTFFLFFLLLFPVALIIFYFLEAIKFFYDFLSKKLKKPVLTKKTIFLTFVAFVFHIFYFLKFFQNNPFFVFCLLIFDILTPLIISAVVLLFQPLTVLLRNQVIHGAKRKREQFRNLLVIGITGSYGKTSTKEFLASILSEKFKVLKTKAHQNSEIGISRCILDDLNESHQIFIVEMGAYNRGGIKLLCGIARPKIGILTGINEQHMALFGSLENIIKAKYELIEALPENGAAIFNGNNEIIKNSRFKIQDYNPNLKDIKFCSTKEKMDIWVEDMKTEKEHVTFKAFYRYGDSATFRVNLLGAQNVENILLAICCAKGLGMSFAEISKACEKIKQEKGTMGLIKTKEGLNIIDSTYSANPDGVLSHLEYLKIWEGKKAIVMPCLIELGKNSKEIHRRIGQEIGKVCDLAIVTTKDRFKELKRGALESGMQKDKILFMEKPKSILEKLKNFSQKEDIILLEGRVPVKLKNLWKFEK